MKIENHCGDEGVNEWVIIKWLVNKYILWVWTGMGWLKIGISSVSLLTQVPQ
jgi:hypothetical protein